MRSCGMGRIAIILAVVGSATTLGGCFAPPECLFMDEAPPIAWNDVEDKVTMSFDVSTTTMTDAQLVAKYSTDRVQAFVREIEITGDRYMLLLEAQSLSQTIVIPGTNLDDFQDILADLDFILTPDEELGIRLDAGFREDALDVREDVVNLLEPNYTTHIVGYSLGGGIAVILAAYLEHDGFNIGTVTTFGQPRVTDAVGVERLESLPLRRFKAASDAVPDLPPGDYRHFGPEVILLDGAYFVYLEQDNPNYDASTRPVEELLDDDFSLADHGSYPARAASKVGQTNQQVSFCDRFQYIQN